VERGEMSLHGAYFGVAEGSLFVLDQTAKQFRSVRGTADELNAADGAEGKPAR
jgi:carbonic anhydrase